MTVVSFAQYSDINRNVFDGKTPLVLAAESGHDYLVEKLLEHNAKPEFVDNNGNTAAEIAVANDHDSIVKKHRKFEHGFMEPWGV